MELERAITKRHSTREFSERLVDAGTLTLIEDCARQIPSAGNLRPLVLYRAPVEKPPHYIIICANFGKTTLKYGKRGIRYVYMEAGHAAQNICLMCEDLGLGSCCVGAFNDKEVKERYGLEHYPVYIVSIGYPKEKR